MKLRYSKQDINYLFFVVLIFTYWINVKLFLIFRITDILILLYVPFFFFMNQFKKSPVHVYFKLFLVCIVISFFIGLVTFEEVNMDGVIFYYKYFIFFGTLWMVLSADLQIEQRNKLIKLLFITFVALVIYAYIRTALYSLGIVTGWPRPDFPFSDNEESGNAGHLFGAFISTGFIAAIAYWPNVKNKRKYLLMLILAFGAIVLSGSRGPFVGVGFAFFVFFIKRFFEKITYENPALFKKLTVVTVKVILFFIILMLILSIIFPYQMGVFEVLARRAFDFSFEGSNDSARGRLRKAAIGFENIANGLFVFGTGPTTFAAFFDNSLTRIVNDSGLLGLLFIFALIVNILKRLDKRKKIICYYLLLAIVFNNLTAEFFLVTRYAVPAVLALGLLLKQNKYVENQYNYSSI